MVLCTEIMSFWPFPTCLKMAILGEIDMPCYRGKEMGVKIDFWSRLFLTHHRRSSRIRNIFTIQPFEWPSMRLDEIGAIFSLSSHFSKFFNLLRLFCRLLSFFCIFKPLTKGSPQNKFSVIVWNLA